MSKAEVLLIRHCESTANAGLWKDYNEEVLLTKQGEAQAEALAEQIESNPKRIILSPLKRAQDSAIPILAKYPDAISEIWPIEEFHYLDNAKYSDSEQRLLAIKQYWANHDPDYIDGPNAESFSGFINRIQSFHLRLKILLGLNIVISHGQFIKAYLLCLEHGFKPSDYLMQTFRAQETQNPIKNGEIIKLELS